MIKNGRLINPEVRIETTNLCNAKCTICPRKKLTRRKTTMPMDHFINLAVQAKTLGAKMASLFGYGEPLLDPTISDKINFCDSLDLKTTITTNASLLNGDRAEEIMRSGLTEIRFSCHGWGEDYEKTHKNLDWETSYNNIMGFLQVNHGITTNLSFIPMNGETVDSIRAFWEHKVDYLEIWSPHNWAGAKNYRKVAPRKATCGRPFGGPIQINADGKMMVCCFDFDAALTIGDTYRESIKDILDGEKLKEIQRRHKSCDLDGLVCGSCDQLNIEGISPLLYSNRNTELGKTSTFKTEIGERK